MRSLTIRKAYKVSCELKERTTNGKTAVSSSALYEVNNARGQLTEVISELHAAQKSELARQYAALQLVCKIRQRIQAANNRPLPYAEGKTISDMIAEQATIKTLLSFYPEDNTIAITSELGLNIQAQRSREQLASDNYRHVANANLSVQGTSQEIADYLSTERLALRVLLEEVTSKLAYANITETVELADEEAEILVSFRIPV